MLKKIINEASIKQLRQLLQKSRRIVITCHMSPDGDAIGSSLGLYHILSAIGKDVAVITPDTPPKNLMFLPEAKSIVIFSRYEQFARELLQKADLIFSLDYNAPQRIDLMAQPLCDSAAKKVLIDHHLFPENFTDVIISHPELSSTAMLIFKVACRLELFPRINKAAATCIYTGMMTDTGNFAYNSNDPDIYVIISELLKIGIDKDAIYSAVYNSNSVNRLRLNGYAINQKMEVYPEHHAALITLTRRELNDYEYKRGDTESLVNVPLSVPDIAYSFFLREETDYIKVSSRSKGEFPVNTICEKYFNGGGHKNAAGGEFHGTMEEAVKVFRSILDENDKYFSL